MADITSCSSEADLNLQLAAFLLDWLNGAVGGFVPIGRNLQINLKNVLVESRREKQPADKKKSQ